MTEAEARERVLGWLYRNEASRRLINRVSFQEYDQLWLAYFRSRSGGLSGIRLVVDKEDGSVHPFTTDVPVDEIVREYLERKGR